MDELLGTLLWVNLELVVRLRVPEHRDSISLGLHKVVTGHWVRATIFMLSFPSWDWIRLEGLDEARTLGRDKCATGLFIFMKRDKPANNCLALDDLI